MENYKRKSISDKLNKWCHMSDKDLDFIELTEWNNGEGFDVAIENGESKNISLTYGELDAILVLSKLVNHD